MFAKRRLLGAFLLFAASALAFGQKTINLSADYWMPYNGDGTKETGYMLDIAKAVFEPAGYKIKFVIAPWSRAVAQARTGETDGIVGALANDAPDFVFPAESQGLCKNSFFVKAESKWQYTGVASLASVQLGVIDKYSYFDEVDKYIKENPSHVTLSFGDNPLSKMIQMMFVGRLDAIVENEAVMEFTLSNQKLTDKIVCAGSEGSGEPIFIAFSPGGKNSELYARMLSEGMVSLRKNGKLAVILAKYNLKDWK